MIPLAGPMATLCERLILDVAADDPRMRPRHLDASALDTPTLALANAARETLRMGDVVEHMMILQREVLHGKQGVDKEVRRLDDDVDVLYTAIKLYLAQIQKEDLGEEDSRRWAEIIEMALNPEQAGDIIERMAGDVGAKSHAARRAFSTEGLAELDGLHERLIGNLRLGLSVFLSGDVTSAKRLRRSNTASAFWIAATRTRTSIACTSKTCRASRPARCIWDCWGHEAPELAVLRRGLQRVGSGCEGRRSRLGRHPEHAVKNAPVFTGALPRRGALFAAEHAGFGVRLFR